MFTYNIIFKSGSSRTVECANNLFVDDCIHGPKLVGLDSSKKVLFTLSKDEIAGIFFIPIRTVNE